MSARPVPPTSELTAPYWDAARRGELTLQRCESCGQRPFPPRAHCSACGAASLSWAPVSGRGTVHSYTVLHHPLIPGYDFPLPVGLIDLEEGTRLVANVVGCKPEEIHIGMKVECVFEDVDETMKLPFFYAVK